MEQKDLKGIIIEDEENSRLFLRGLLQEYCQGVNIVAEAGRVNEAIALIRQHKPDLVFLDIELAGESGFTILESLGKDISFDTIFVTAYQEYALKAFRYSAVSYLLKPVILGELQEAIARIKERKEKEDPQKQIEFLLSLLKKPEAKLERIALPTREGYVIAEIKDIVRLMADGSYTTVFFKTEEPVIVCRNIATFEEILSNSGMVRIQKSAIINLRYLKKYVKSDGGYVVMFDNEMISVSPGKRDELLEKLKKV